MGIIENNMETTIVSWGYIGLKEKKMETTVTVRLSAPMLQFVLLFCTFGRDASTVNDFAVSHPKHFLANF